MAELKISGRMSVKRLKENFKNEFGGTLRVYDGREKADDNATLASIRRNNEAKGGELVCNGNKSVGNFEKDMLRVFGIKVQVATPDDWTLVLDGITLSRLKDIPEKTSKADMEHLVAYKRRAKEDESVDVEETETSQEIDDIEENGGDLNDDRPIFNFEFKTIDWELTEANIEKHRKEIDIYGVVVVLADDEENDECVRKVIAEVDVADGLYDAIDIINELKEENPDYDITVEYTTKCEIYGAGEPYEHGEDFGYVMSSYMGTEENPYWYNLESGALCRYNNTVWTTDEGGDVDEFDCMSVAEFMEILEKRKK